jgi:hypothetical protein
MLIAVACTGITSAREAIQDKEFLAYVKTIKYRLTYREYTIAMCMAWDYEHPEYYYTWRQN